MWRGKGSALARVALACVLALACIACGPLLGIDDGVPLGDDAASGGGDDGTAPGTDAGGDGPTANGDAGPSPDAQASDAHVDAAHDAPVARDSSVEACTPDPSFCTAHCGTSNDNCGAPRACPGCGTGFTCDPGTHTCACAPDPSWCNNKCGATHDNCN